jgi:hypothetical protein
MSIVRVTERRTSFTYPGGNLIHVTAVLDQPGAADLES